VSRPALGPTQPPMEWCLVKHSVLKFCHGSLICVQLQSHRLPDMGLKRNFNTEFQIRISVFRIEISI